MPDNAATGTYRKLRRRGEEKAAQPDGNERHGEDLFPVAEFECGDILHVRAFHPVAIDHIQEGDVRVHRRHDTEVSRGSAWV